MKYEKSDQEFCEKLTKSSLQKAMIKLNKLEKQSVKVLEIYQIYCLFKRKSLNLHENSGHLWGQKTQLAVVEH